MGLNIDTLTKGVMRVGEWVRSVRSQPCLSSLLGVPSSPHTSEQLIAWVLLKDLILWSFLISKLYLPQLSGWMSDLRTGITLWRRMRMTLN